MKARVFGAGSIGNHITYALKSINYDVEVVDVDDSALLRMKNQIYPSRYKKWDDSIDLLLEPSKNFVDLEVIGTPPDKHAEILLEGINRNRAKAWLVEKPFTFPDPKHVNDLKNNLKGFEDKVYVGYNHSVAPAFIDLLKELKNKKNIKKIYCNWLEHWGGIFNAHPWLSGPKDSYLGFSKRGGGSLMEHSHGLHMLLIVINHLNLKTNKTNFCISKDSSNSYDKYVNIVFELENGTENLIATYTTDVLTKDISKKIVVETEKEVFSVEFGASNGSFDIFQKKSEKQDSNKIYKKNRPDDFKYEVDLLDDILNGGSPEFKENLSCKWGLEVSKLCSQILTNNINDGK